MSCRNPAWRSGMKSLCWSCLVNLIPSSLGGQKTPPPREWPLPGHRGWWAAFWRNLSSETSLGSREEWFHAFNEKKVFCIFVSFLTQEILGFLTQEISQNCVESYGLEHSQDSADRFGLQYALEFNGIMLLICSSPSGWPSEKGIGKMQQRNCQYWDNLITVFCFYKNCLHWDYKNKNQPPNPWQNTASTIFLVLQTLWYKGTSWSCVCFIERKE